MALCIMYLSYIDATEEIQCSLQRHFVHIVGNETIYIEHVE